MLVAADRVGNKATAGVVTIVFTPVSVIPIGGTITINTPFNYFAPRAAAAAVGASSITCATACASANDGDVAVTNTAASGWTAAFGSVTICVAAGATTASAITLSIGIGTLTTGTPQAATTTGITVSTTQDRVSAGSASQALGGFVNAKV